MLRAEFNPTAEIVVEIVSPGDESRMKFDFYFQAFAVEVLIVDPEERRVEWFDRGADGFVAIPRSTLLDRSADDLSTSIDWPR